MSMKSLSLTYYNRIRTVRGMIKSSSMLLDAGCSDGYIDFLIQDKVKHVHGIDINKSDIEIARLVSPKNKYTVGSLYKLPYKDGSFDTVICMDVLEHLDDDRKAVSEFKRVLKQGGKLIITVPCLDFPFTYDPINFFLKIFNKHIPHGIWGFGHRRLYTGKHINSLLKDEGFKVVESGSMSHCLVGLLENSYAVNIIQPLFKSDPMNQAGSAKDKRKLYARLTKSPPRLLAKVRDIILNTDSILKGRSINVFAVAEK